MTHEVYHKKTKQVVKRGTLKVCETYLALHHPQQGWMGIREATKDEGKKSSASTKGKGTKPKTETSEQGLEDGSNASSANEAESEEK